MLLLKSITKDPDRSKVHLTVPSYIHFHCALGFDTQTLADMLDSLVRVSRRVVESHYVNILSLYVGEPRPKGKLRSSVPVTVCDRRL
jgi:hypothetical protein